MFNYKSNIGVSAVAVLLIIFQLANARDPISYEDFLQSYENAVTSAMGKELKVSKLPPEVLYFIVDLYEDDILNDFPTATKNYLTKLLTSDFKSRKIYYEENITIFKAFVLKVLEAEMKNSGLKVKDKSFLSSMRMDTVVELMKEAIISTKASLDDRWKILNLKDAFRTVYFYCKYPKEMAPFLTETMRDQVKEWLDPSVLKLEL